MSDLRGGCSASGCAQQCVGVPWGLLLIVVLSARSQWMGQGTEAGTQPAPLSTLPAARLRSGPVKAVPKLWPASVQSKRSQAGQLQGRGWGLEGKTRERVCCDKTGREARVRLLWAWVMGHGDLADSAGAANCPGHSSSGRLASCLKPAHHLGHSPAGWWPCHKASARAALSTPCWPGAGARGARTPGCPRSSASSRGGRSLGLPRATPGIRCSLGSWTECAPS